jgi:uncharacterized SAM-binding protein YcdF (DUF218 family)
VNLPIQAKARADKAIELFHNGKAPKTLFAGRWSYKAATPFLKTEAQAMADYAKGAGVPEKAILTEIESVDTLTNFLYSKTVLEHNNWHSVCIVTSSDHRARTEYLAHKVLGSAYEFDIEVCEDRLDDNEFTKQTEREQKSFQITKDYLDKYEDGDSEGIWKFVRRSHPAFTDSPLVTKEELMKQMGESQADYE